MNAAPDSVLLPRRRSKRPTANSRVTRSRAALSSNVTNMPSRTAGQKVERLNADAWLHSRPFSSAKRGRAQNSLRLASPTAPLGHVSSAGVRPTPLTRASDQTLTLSQRSAPIWLSPLLFLKRSSDIITFLLVAGTLGIYSWTVYTQQQWSQEYRKLETLQRHERQMTTANAALKDQLAQQAESPAAGLVNPTRPNAIVLPPAPQRQSHTASTKTSDSEPAGKTPLGY